MATATPHLAIDARPRGPRGPLACEVVLGRTVLARLVDQLTALAPGQPIAVHASESEPDLLARLLSGAHADRLQFLSGPPAAARWVLRTDRLYETGRLRRAFRTGRS